jgi:hypothetical protein
MTTSEDDHSDDGRSAATARLGRTSPGRSRILAGTAGLAAILGVGAYLTTSALIADDTRVAQDVRPVVPMVATSAPDALAPSPTPAGSASASSTATPAEKAPPTGPETVAVGQAGQAERNPEEVRKEIMAARREARKHGYSVQRPLTADAPPEAISERTRSTPDGGTMRITTVKGDLTGQRPLLWAADDGEPAGDSRCTQKFRFSEGDLGVVRPTMLLCWRTSASRSVAVLSVTPDGTPSATDTTATLDREWKKLG